MYSLTNDINDIGALDRTDAARLADLIFDLVLIAPFQRDSTFARRSRVALALALADARSHATDQISRRINGYVHRSAVIDLLDREMAS